MAHDALNTTKPTYLYIAQTLWYSDEIYTKIGVSINPEKRAVTLARDLRGPVTIFKKYLMNSRKEAFRIEAIVKRSFIPIEEFGTETFHIKSEKIQRFVERLL